MAEQTSAEMRAEIARMLAENKARFNAQQASAEDAVESASEEASWIAYDRYATIGMVDSVHITMESSKRVNKIVSRDVMRDIGRTIGVSKRVQALYDGYLKRCIVQAYKSQFHKDPQTKKGYLKNSPLVYRNTGRIGYGSGKLYNSIDVRYAEMQTTTFDEYGSKLQVFRFIGPQFNSYGEILSTGKRSRGPIPIHELIEWINKKRLSGYLKNKDVKTEKQRLAFAMAIMNSYRKGRTADGTTVKREQSMKDWEKWEKNERVKSLFQKIYQSGADRYYKMMLEDVLKTYQNR